MAPLTCRPATDADVAALVALIRAAYRGPASRTGWSSEADLVAGERIDAGQLRQALGARDVRVLLAERGGRLQGCCQVARIAVGRASFGTFAVTPDAQGAGVGAQLLAYAEDVAARELSVAELEITVLAPQAALLRFYERRGFARTGETRPFPADGHYARPLVGDLRFVVLRKPLSGGGAGESTAPA